MFPSHNGGGEAVPGLYRSASRVSFPSPLTHSWPLFERRQHFDLGCLFDSPDQALAEPEQFAGPLEEQGIGLWQCELHDNALTWTDIVFDLFGLPRGVVVTRDEAIALYAEPSRAAMERLRAHAIKHRRGFTLDAEIVPMIGPRRWMRLIAAPVCVGSHVVRLHGIKQDVSAAYL